MSKPLSILDLIDKYLGESYDDLVNNKGNAAQPLEDATDVINAGPLRELLKNLTAIVKDYYEGHEDVKEDVSGVNTWYKSIFGGECIVGEPNQDSIANCILKVRDKLKENHAEDGYCIYEKDANPIAIEACKTASNVFERLKDSSGNNRMAYAFGNTVVVSEWKGEVAGVSVGVDMLGDDVVINAYGDVIGDHKNAVKIIANAIGFDVNKCKYDEVKPMESSYLVCPLDDENPREISAIGAAASHALLTEKMVDLESEAAVKLEFDRFKSLISG